MTPRSSPKSYPASSAMCTIARVSFGKQLWATNPKDVTIVCESGTSSEYTVPQNGRLTASVTRTHAAFFESRR